MYFSFAEILKESDFKRVLVSCCTWCTVLWNLYLYRLTTSLWVKLH